MSGSQKSQMKIILSEVNQTKLFTTLFHLNEILEKINPIHSLENIINLGCYNKLP